MSQLSLLDNTVLSNFARVQLASAVYSYWKGQARTTSQVLAEYHAGVIVAGLPATAWRELPVLELTPAETNFGDTLPARLGDGERSCLAVAHARQAIIATDDLFARQVAKRYRILAVGTFGILTRCVQRGILTHSKAQAALDQMIAAGYRAPIDNLGAL